MSDTPKTDALYVRSRTRSEVLSSHEKMERELAAVTAELDALRADARRMTFLEKNGYAVDMLADPDNDVLFWFGNGYHVCRGTTLREAIDKAIAESKEKP